MANTELSAIWSYLHSRGDSLDIGRKYSWSSFRNFATCTWFSFPGNTSDILRNIHFFRLLYVDMTKTAIPILKSFSFLNHFYLLFNQGSHSFIHFPQKCFTIFWQVFIVSSGCKILYLNYLEKLSNSKTIQKVIWRQ